MISSSSVVPREEKYVRTFLLCGTKSLSDIIYPLAVFISIREGKATSLRKKDRQKARMGIRKRLCTAGRAMSRGVKKKQKKTGRGIRKRLCTAGRGPS